MKTMAEAAVAAVPGQRARAVGRSVSPVALRVAAPNQTVAVWSWTLPPGPWLAGSHAVASLLRGGSWRGGGAADMRCRTVRPRPCAPSAGAARRAPTGDGDRPISDRHP